MFSLFRKTRRVSFSREELQRVLEGSSYTPERLVVLFETDFGKEFASDAGVWQGYSVKEHTLMVMRQFEKYFSKIKLPADIDMNFFRVILALHDIGVPAAIREGVRKGEDKRKAKRRQHKHTVRIMGPLLRQLRFDTKDINRALPLVSADPIGEYLTKGGGEKATHTVRRMAEKAGIQAGDFLNLLLVLFMVDAGSYTEDAGGVKALDYLFVFDKNKKEMKFAGEPEDKILQLMIAVSGRPGIRWVAGHDWHDVGYDYLRDWVKNRKNELDRGAILRGSRFRYRRNPITGKYQIRLSTKTKEALYVPEYEPRSKFKHRRHRSIGSYQRRLRYYLPRVIRRTKRGILWFKRNLGRILILLAVLATIAMILSAVGLSISGDVSLTAGIVICVVGLVILLWSLRTLSKRRPRLPSLVMVLLISLIFVMFSSAYLDVRSFADIKNSITGAFTTEAERFRSNVEALVERVELTFVEVTENIVEEIEEVANTQHVHADGALLAGADGHLIKLVNNPDATDPTWNELKAFLAKDATDQQTYSFASFVCADFAEMLHNNAEAAGIRAAYVVVELGPSSYYSMYGGHALNAFQTTDMGLVYIDCTAPIDNYGGSADKIVDVQVGEPYIPESVFPHGGWYWSSMGVVEEIEVIQW